MNALPPPSPPVPACLVQSAAEYSLPLRAVLAILYVEGGAEGTKSKNTNGTVDHGPFQINTTWVNQLEKSFGIPPELLTNDFCWSARAASFILRYEINLAGGSFWDGVGHYHSRNPARKAAYIQKVFLKSQAF